MKKILALLLTLCVMLIPVLALGETYAVFDTISLMIPDGATVVGGEICNGEMEPIMFVGTAFFETSVLMEEYGYANEEECVLGIVEMQGGLTIQDGGKYDPGVNGYPLYVYHCSAVKYMPPDGEAVESSDPLTLALLIDEANELIYPIFFYDEMSVDQTVLSVLGTVSAYENNYAQRALEGLYAWEGGAEFYLD